MSTDKNSPQTLATSFQENASQPADGILPLGEWECQSSGRMNASQPVERWRDADEPYTLKNPLISQNVNRERP